MKLRQILILLSLSFMFPALSGNSSQADKIKSISNFSWIGRLKSHSIVFLCLAFVSITPQKADAQPIVSVGQNLEFMITLPPGLAAEFEEAFGEITDITYFTNEVLIENLKGQMPGSVADMMLSVGSLFGACKSKSGDIKDVIDYTHAVEKNLCEAFGKANRLECTYTPPQDIPATCDRLSDHLDASHAVVEAYPNKDGSMRLVGAATVWGCDCKPEPNQPICVWRMCMAFPD